MEAIRNFLRRARPGSSTHRHSNVSRMHEQHHQGDGSGIHYLATQRGFLKGFEPSPDARRNGEIRALFTSNMRFAQQFDSFQDADNTGKRLMTQRQGVRYYAIVKPA